MIYTSALRVRKRGRGRSLTHGKCHWSQTVIEAYVNYLALTELLQWLCCYCYCLLLLFLCSFCTSFSLYWFFAAAASCSCCWLSCSCYYCRCLAVAVASVVLSLLFSPHGSQLQLLFACTLLSLLFYSLSPTLPFVLSLSLSQAALKPVTFYSFQFVVYFLLISRFMQLSPPSPPSLLLFLLNAVWPHKICKLKVAIVLFSSFFFFFDYISKVQ